jgi:hypothetical protein
MEFGGFIKNGYEMVNGLSFSFGSLLLYIMLYQAE